jgi:tetratricopeptide (TPR) repeat protein
MARLELLAGNAPQAEAYADNALSLFPGYPDGLRAMAEVRRAQERNEEAAALLETLCAEAPRAGNLYALAKALDRAGKKDRAGKAWSEFERKALQERDLADNANRELSAYYADYAGEPRKALEVATEELKRRHDAFTLDAHAWALAACGDYGQAAAEMAKALEFGIREAEILRHAAEIAKRQPTAGSR